MSTGALILGLHLITGHADTPPGVELHSRTPGIYVRMPSGATLGAYRNSHGSSSAYAGWTWSTADGRWSITAGGVTGYPRAPVVPLLVPSLRIPITDDAALRLSALAKAHRDGAAGIHLSVEFSIR